MKPSAQHPARAHADLMTEEIRAIRARGTREFATACAVVIISLAASAAVLLYAIR